MQQNDFRDFLSSLFIVSAGCACFLLFVDNEESIVSSKTIKSCAILWISSISCGYLSSKIAAGSPPLLGSLISGIIVKNCNIDGFALSPEFGEAIRAVGLCIVLLMSSLEIDIGAVTKAGAVSLRLTFLPGIIEAFTCAVSSVWIFGMPWPFALSLGFILAAVSPAIVVPGMFDLQKKGYGVEKGIPSIVMAAASFDDIVAITGFTICIGIAIDAGSSSNLALSAFLHGPVSIFLGLVSGAVGGVVLAMTIFCSNRWHRTAIALEICLLMTYAYKRVHFEGCGSVATLLSGIFAKQLWKLKRVREHIKSDETEYFDQIESDVHSLWDIAICPLLFGTIGTAFDLETLPKDMILKSCSIVILGLIVRVPAAFLSSSGSDLRSKERLFVALAWVPKATVQAALCAMPLSSIMKNFSDNENFEELVMVGNQIMTTSILAIIISAPIGLLSIQFLGPILMEQQQSKGCSSPSSQHRLESKGSKTTP